MTKSELILSSDGTLAMHQILLKAMHNFCATHAGSQKNKLSDSDPESKSRIRIKS